MGWARVGGKVDPVGDMGLVGDTGLVGNVVPATVLIWKFEPPVFTFGLAVVHWCPVGPVKPVAVGKEKSKLSRSKRN